MKTRPAGQIVRKIAWLRALRSADERSGALSGLAHHLAGMGEPALREVAVTMAFTGRHDRPVALFVGLRGDAPSPHGSLEEAAGCLRFEPQDAASTLEEHQTGLPHTFVAVPVADDGRLLLPRTVTPAQQDLEGLMARLHRLHVPLTLTVEAKALSPAEVDALVPMLHTAQALREAFAPTRADGARAASLLDAPEPARADTHARLLAQVRTGLCRATVRLASDRPLDERTRAEVVRCLEQGGLQLSDNTASPGAGIVHASNLAALVQLPLAPGPLPHLRVERTAHLPAPVDGLDRGLLLGEADTPRGTREVRVLTEDLARHAWVVGKTGAGKTTLLETLAASAIEQGDQAVIVVDPHGDMVANLLAWLPPEHADRTVVVDFADPEALPALNLLEASDAQQREFAIGELDAMFLSMYGPEIWGPRIQDAFRNFASLLSHDPEGPGTLVDLLWAVNLRNDTVRERFEAIARSTGSISHTLFLQQIQERRMGDGSLQELVSYYRAKFSPFVDNPTLRLVLGQRRSTLDVQRFIRERRVCLFNLSKGRISSRYATLLGRVLVTRIFQAAIASGSLPAAERPPVMLVLDEFQNLVSPSIEDIVAEARKFRLSLVVANQHISQVDRNLTDVRSGGGVLDALLGNIGALVSFRVSGSDAQRLAAEMGPDMPADALSGLPPWNAVCHLSRGGASLPPFTLRTRPLVPRRDRRVAEKVLRRSRQEVCVPRDQAERAIRARVLACTGQVETPEDAMSALFRSL